MMKYAYILGLLAIIGVVLMMPRLEHFEPSACAPQATSQTPTAVVSSPTTSTVVTSRTESSVPIDCPFPLEKYNDGCRLKCPTTTFLLNSPQVFCQKVISGGIMTPDSDGNCPQGYISDPVGCVKLLSACPPNLDLKDGACHERCPVGTLTTVTDVEIDNDKGFVEKARTRVCHK